MSAVSNLFSNLFRNPQEKNSDYRPEVDGLRAIAVLSVIFYHLDPNFLPGGYVGVDIFFVISGYLITSHLLTEIVDRNSFSFKKFYGRRIRRILPALLGVIIFSLIMGFSFLTSYYFKNLGSESFYALLSTSNIYFYLNSGYFDLDSSMRPLLHTWSLGVEEQFYLVWPILLLVIYKLFRSRVHIIILLVLLCVSSFVANGLFQHDPSGIFYLMPFRIFELSIGGMIAWLHGTSNFQKTNNAKLSNYLSIVGMAALLSPLFYLDHGIIFPYYNALPTVLGSAILILTFNTYVSRLLSFRPIVYIGLLSYSMYLYHWPLIFFLDYLQINDSARPLTVFSLTLFFSFISYHVIEKPFRYNKRTSLNCLLACGIAMATLISYQISQGVITSLLAGSELISESENRDKHTNNMCDISKDQSLKNCDMDADNQLLFIGNSHNMDGYNIFHNLFDGGSSYNLIFAGNFNNLNCGYSYLENELKFISKTNKCNAGANLLSSENFISKIDVIVINYFRLKDWGAYHTKVIKELVNINKNLKVIIIGGFIGLRPEKCKELVNKTGNLDACKDPQNITSWPVNELDWIKEQDYGSASILYIDRIKLLCGDEKKLENCKVRDGSSLYFYDGDHFSLTGAKAVADELNKQYGSLISDFIKTNETIVIKSQLRKHNLLKSFITPINIFIDISKSKHSSNRPYQGNPLSMWWGGNITSSMHTLKPGNYSIKILAKGTKAHNEYAKFRTELVTDDGHKIVDFTEETEKTFAIYSKDFRLDKASNVFVKFTFINDGSDPETKEDRNLFLNSIYFQKVE